MPPADVPVPAGQGTGAVAVDSLSPALIEAELARLTASDTFARSPRQVQLLRHLLDATRRGDSAALREMNLALSFFARDPARFDPRSDSTVRVQVGRLRRRLAGYYADEALDARLEFRLPTRSFRVEVLRRQVPAPEQRPRASLVLFDFGLQDVPSLEPRPRSRPALPASPQLVPALGPGAAGAAAMAASLTGELGALLARLNGLRVVMGGARLAPPGAMRQAARALGCAHLLLGTLGGAGVPYTLSLRLQRTDDEALLWHHEVALSTQDAAACLLAPARSLIAELHRQAAGRRLQRIGPAAALTAPSRERVAQARDTLALARVAMLTHSVAGYDSAARLVQQALAEAPDDADAHALLAQAQMGRAGLTAVPSRPALEAARQAAETALQLDPDQSAAHGVLAQVRLHVDHDWSRAEARHLAALRTAPGSAPAHAGYGWALMMNRRFAEAHAAYAEARDLDPQSLLYRCHQALVSLYERDWARAAAGFERVLGVMPQHLIALALRAALHLYTHELDAALRAYQVLHLQWPGLSIGRCGLAQTLALQGDTKAARAHLAELEAMASSGWVSPYQRAMVLHRLGQDDAALQALADSAQSADYNFACVGVDPAFDRLRGHADWPGLLRRFGCGHLLP